MGDALVKFVKDHWGKLAAGLVALVLGWLAAKYEWLAPIVGPLTTQP